MVNKDVYIYNSMYIEYRPIQIVTRVEVISENFVPEVCKKLPEIEDRQQHCTN